jgi:hypothetical protein
MALPTKSASATVKIASARRMGSVLPTADLVFFPNKVVSIGEGKEILGCQWVDRRWIVWTSNSK